MSFSSQAQKLAAYYRWHAPIYDATRWSFLLGRERLVHSLPDLPPRPRILEVGCGTGWNLPSLLRLYPEAQILGIDLSKHMLRHASRRVKENPQLRLINASYGAEQIERRPFDLILLSYSITMMHEMRMVLNQINDDLRAGGHIAVVDFHRTSLGWFERWMAKNHVLMNGRLLPLLKKTYRPVTFAIHTAYLGWWSYFSFLGNKK